MSVAVICPSRHRPDHLKIAAESVWKTSDAKVYARIDKDGGNYPDIYGVKYVVGERVGCAQSINDAVTGALLSDPDISVFAFMTDDSKMTAKGWDEYLLGFAGSPHVISPHTSDGGAHRVDMPAITVEMYDHLGWYAHPTMFHYGWPTVLGLLADGICLTRAPKDKFAIKHDNIASKYSTFEHDSVEFYQWAAWHLDDAREALRKAVGGGA